MNSIEYNNRRAAAEANLDRQVEAWRQTPKHTGAKFAAWMAGLLTTAAVIGFSSGYGVDGAQMAATLITLPALAVSGFMSGSSQDTETYRASIKDKAYAAAGLSGVRDPSRGPSLLDRLAQLIGRPAADKIAARAPADIAAGTFGPQPKDVRYLIDDAVIEPWVAGNPDPARCLKIRLTETGEALVIRSAGGKLDSSDGRPSSARIDPEGGVVAAAWHQNGAPVASWNIASGKPFSIVIKPSQLAGELMAAAAQLPDDAAERLFELSDSLHELSEKHVTLTPVTLRDGLVDVGALEIWVNKVFDAWEDVGAPPGL